MSRTIAPRAAAIVGIGTRLPGGTGPDVRGPAHTWQALQTGVSAITRFPEQRWKAMRDRLHPTDRETDPWPVAHLDLPAPGSLDTSVLGLRTGEGTHLSPTQILLLQVAAEAVDDAGVAPASLAGAGTGLYPANSTPDEALDVFGDQQRPDLMNMPAGGAGMLATPVSRWLDTRGPLLTYDASCAASMYALDAARRDLADGRVDTAIVIGSNTVINPVINRAFVSGGVLADDGNLSPFDTGAHGHVRGEAVVAVVLRTYRAARRDRDRIYAVLEHTTVGADGRSAGTGMPSADAQAELISRALAEADVHPNAVGYLLAHGTGTIAGDREEAKALRRVFGRTASDPLLVGSIKGLWGHAEAAAGLTGVIAAALTLHHGRIPPTVGHTHAPPRLARQGLSVPTRSRAWPDRGLPTPPIVGVSGFGFSGAIAHAVLRSVPPHAPTDITGDQGGAVVLPLAAHTASGLRSQAGALASAVEGSDAPDPEQIGDHLTRRRDQPAGARAAIIDTDHGPRIGPALEALAAGRTHPALVSSTADTASQHGWVFGGHGAAHPGMGTTLYRTDEMFAAQLDQVLQALTAQPSATGWHPITSPALETLTCVQQATFAMQVALAHTLTRRWGLAPDVVVGHSLGEVAAAHIAGILSLKDAAQLVCARSVLLERIITSGSMVTARLEAATAHDLAQHHQVEIACHNSPTHVTFSGAESALDTLMQELRTRRDADPRRLEGAPPAHSSHVEPVLHELAEALTGLSPRGGHTTMVSTVLGKPVHGTDLGADYWVRQLRAPVLLEQAVVHLAEEGGPTLLQEISPLPVLIDPLAHTRARHHLNLDLETTASLRDERLGLAGAVAAAHTHHLPVSWPYQIRTPVEMAPASWAPTAVDRWVDQVANLTGKERHQALVEVVHAAVADLAAVPVREKDRGRDLSTLGLNSLHRLSLRATLLSALPSRPRDLPDHEPTIVSIATALGHLLPEGRHNPAP